MRFTLVLLLGFTVLFGVPVGLVQAGLVNTFDPGAYAPFVLGLGAVLKVADEETTLWFKRNRGKFTTDYFFSLWLAATLVAYTMFCTVMFCLVSPYDTLFTAIWVAVWAWYKFHDKIDDWFDRMKKLFKTRRLAGVKC